MDNKTYDKIYCSDKYHKLNRAKKRKEAEYLIFMTKKEFIAYLTGDAKNKIKPK